MRRAFILSIGLSIGIGSYILGQVVPTKPQPPRRAPSAPQATAPYPTLANDGWTPAQAAERSARAQTTYGQPLDAAPPQPASPYSPAPATPPALPAPLPAPQAYPSQFPSYPPVQYGLPPSAVGEPKQPTNQELLAKKLQELDNLRLEVERLRRLTGTTQQVVVKLRMVEVSLTKLRDLQTEPAVCDPALLERLRSAQPNALMTAEEIRALDRLLAHLGKEGAARVLAEPTIVTYSGRPASFHSGGEFPLHAKSSADRDSIQYKRYGTEFDCVPTSLGNNRVRLDLKFRVSEIDEAHSITVNNAQAPGLCMKEVNTAAEMELGQTMILHAATNRREVVAQRVEQEGVVRNAARSEDLLSLVMVTPEAIDTPQRAQAPQQTGQRLPPSVSTVAPSPPAEEPGPVVVVECRVLDISLTKLRSLGFDAAGLLDVYSKAESPSAAPGPASAVPQPSGGLQDDPLAGLVIGNSDAARGFIECLKAENIAQVVARPQLTTLSGQPAEVRVGRDVDVPDRDHPGKIGKGFAGTEMKVLPRVNAEGRIEIHLTMSVSQQGEPYGYKIDDKPVYSIERMGAETTLTLNDGQTIIAGGLRTRSETSVIRPDAPRNDGDAEATADKPATVKKSVDETNRYVLLTARVVRPEKKPEQGAAAAQPNTTRTRETRVPPPSTGSLE